MKNKTDILIIGGGIAGVSTLYHLAKMGLSNIMLVEKLQLTSGSTWHAAGNLPHFSNSYAVMKMQQYSINLYARLQQETGSFVDHHATGAVRLAHTQDRMDEFKRVAAMADLCGLNLQIIDVVKLKQLYPFLDTNGLLGALWDPDDGHIDPSSVTNAMAAGAKQNGATIVRNNSVQAIQQQHNGRWTVTTAQGTIDAGVIVNAAGFRANEIAAMIGHYLPMIAMEHQFVVTDTINELEQRSHLLPMLRDPDVSYYLRQEGKGFILGPYEKDGIPWAVNGVPAAFGQELLAPDLDRIETIMCTAMEQVPLLETAGIKTVINGPITYTPDGHPLIGPVYGYRNYFVCSGFNFGIVQGGGAGHFLAQWIVNGYPELDVFELDPRRFGDYANHDYCIAKAIEVYANEYQLGFPNEYAMRSAKRGIKVSPIYHSQKQYNAIFGAYYGWERASWFARESSETEEILSFRRSNWFESVANECLQVQHHVGVLDLSPCAKYEISGANAYQWLHNLLPNAIPNKVGKIALAHPLTSQGGIAWQCSITQLANGHYYLVAAAAAERLIDDWLTLHQFANETIHIDNITRQYGILVLAGPKSRQLLSQLTEANLSNQHFPWFSCQEIEVAGVAVRALRINSIGELGWELHHRIEHQQQLYDALMEAGKPWQITNFGLRAMDSMRLEKGYALWRYDLNTEVTLIEADLARFIDYDKKEFVGKAALLQQQATGITRRRVLLELHDIDIDALGMEPLYANQQLVGATSSGGYGHRTQKSLALAYIDIAAINAELTVKILGKHYKATVTSGCVYDVNNERLLSSG